MVLDFMANLDYNVQADNLKCKQPEQNVETSRSLVERARLEIVYTPQGYRGFESLLLRHKSTVILIELRWTFSMPENRLKQGFSTVSAHKRTPLQSNSAAGFVFFAWLYKQKIKSHHSSARSAINLASLTASAS